MVTDSPLNVFFKVLNTFLKCLNNVKETVWGQVLELNTAALFCRGRMSNFKD